MSTIDSVPRLEDDGLPHLEDVGIWALEKYDRVWYYDRLFTNAMHQQWDELVYIDLFAGPGYSQLRERGDLVPGSPLLALRIPNLFDRYIFCEKEPDYVTALRERVERDHPEADVRYVPGDVNDNVERIHSHMPAHGPDHGVLTFCFCDPFDLAPRFETMRKLTEERRMDVMHVMPLAMDGRRNFYKTYVKEDSEKVDEYLGNRDWRDAWKEAELRGERKIARFLARQYVEAMVGIDYLKPDLKNFHPVNAGHLSLYLIGFFSKHRLAYRFWKDAMKYTAGQYSLELG